MCIIMKKNFFSDLAKYFRLKLRFIKKFFIKILTNISKYLKLEIVQKLHFNIIYLMNFQMMKNT